MLLRNFEPSIRELTIPKTEQLIHVLERPGNNIKMFKIFEKDGKRYIKGTVYSAGWQKPSIPSTSARLKALTSLKQYLANATLDQVESYECEYDYANNKFYESGSYSSEISSQSEKINLLKSKLEDLKVISNQLHIEEVEVNGLIITDSDKPKRQAKFNEAIDELIRTLSCEHS